MKSEVMLRAPINREEFGTSCQNSTANDGAFQQSDPFCFGPGRVRPTEGSAIRIHDDLAAGPSRRTVRPFGGHRMCITSLQRPQNPHLQPQHSAPSQHPYQPGWRGPIAVARQSPEPWHQCHTSKCQTGRRQPKPCTSRSDAMVVVVMMSLGR